MIFTPRNRSRFCGPDVYKKFDSLFKIKNYKYKILDVKMDGGNINRNHSKTETASNNLTIVTNNCETLDYIPLSSTQMCVQLTFPNILMASPLLPYVRASAVGGSRKI